MTYVKHPNPEVIDAGARDMFASLMEAVRQCRGDPDYFAGRVAAGMTVLELLEMLGTNDVRFAYLPGHIKRLAPDAAWVACGEFTLTAESGRVTGVTVNEKELTGVRSVAVEGRADAPLTVRLEFDPRGSYPSIP